MGGILYEDCTYSGLSGFIGGGGSDTYFSKNKTRTYEAVMARVTIISAILFALDVIALNLIK
jgi:preprotein translocase subunit SecG